MNEQETRILAAAGLSFEKGPDLLADARAIIDGAKKSTYCSVNAALERRILVLLSEWEYSRSSSPHGLEPNGSYTWSMTKRPHGDFKTTTMRGVNF